MFGAGPLFWFYRYLCNAITLFGSDIPVQGAKRRNHDHEEEIPTKCRKLAGPLQESNEILSRRPLLAGYRIPKKAMSKENHKNNEEEECCVIAEIPRSRTRAGMKAMPSCSTAEEPKPRRCSNFKPPEPVIRPCQESRDSVIIIEEGPFRRQSDDKDIEVLEFVKNDSKNESSWKEFPRRSFPPKKFFQHKRSSLMAPNGNGIKKHRVNKLRSPLAVNIRKYRREEIYRPIDRLKYQMLLQNQMDPKPRLPMAGQNKGLENQKSTKPTIPFIDLTEEKNNILVNKNRERKPQTSSSKTLALRDNESDVEIVGIVPKINSLQDMLKFNPIDTNEILSRHPKALESGLELVEDDSTDDDDNSDSQKKERKALLDDSLEERVLNYLRITDGVTPEVDLELYPELTEAQEKKIRAALSPGRSDEILVQKFNLQITRKDIQSLKGLNWLNDEVINFYMQLIMDRSKTNKSLPKIYAFNTFFYPKLITGGHSVLKRWTKKVDIFSYDIILVPVHLGMHWCLAIIDFKSKEVRYYDSMGAPNDRCLQSLLYYLEAESRDKKEKRYDTSNWEVMNVDNIPQQMNGSDCGVFACMFAEHVTRDAPILFTQDHMPYFRKKMILEILEGKLQT